VRAEDVTLESEIAALETTRQHYQLGATAVLGHSWGAVLALEYAIRHPDRVSHLLLMNPAPASAADLAFFGGHRLNKTALDRERMTVIGATAGYQEGDPDTIAAYCRIHFTAASGSRRTSTT
jgi:proline iminopeptidase